MHARPQNVYVMYGVRGKFQVVSLSLSLYWSKTNCCWILMISPCENEKTTKIDIDKILFECDAIQLKIVYSIFVFSDLEKSKFLRKWVQQQKWWQWDPFQWTHIHTRLLNFQILNFISIKILLGIQFQTFICSVQSDWFHLQWKFVGASVGCRKLNDTLPANEMKKKENKKLERRMFIGLKWFKRYKMNFILT